MNVLDSNAIEHHCGERNWRQDQITLKHNELGAHY